MKRSQRRSTVETRLASHVVSVGQSPKELHWKRVGVHVAPRQCWASPLASGQASGVAPSASPHRPAVQTAVLRTIWSPLHTAPDAAGQSASTSHWAQTSRESDVGFSTFTFTFTFSLISITKSFFVNNPCAFCAGVDASGRCKFAHAERPRVLDERTDHATGLRSYERPGALLLHWVLDGSDCFDEQAGD